MMEPDYYVFTGGRIPDHITHVLIGKALNFVPARAFKENKNIQEVICHDGVTKIGREAFYWCTSLRRVIMPGVKIIEKGAFGICKALTYVECGKLEIIRQWAFCACKSLSSIYMPSIKIVEFRALDECTSLIDAKFGKELESIGEMVFYKCSSLERIALPLKNGMIIDNSTFTGCEKLNCVDLVEGGALLDETIAALLMEEWKNDVNKTICAMNRILASAPAGSIVDDGGKGRTMRILIKSILRKVVHYKAEHRRYVKEAETTLQTALPEDIVLKNVLPFVELPSDTSFEEEN